MRIKLNTRLNLLLVVVMTTGSLGYAEEHRLIFYSFSQTTGVDMQVSMLKKISLH